MGNIMCFVNALARVSINYCWFASLSNSSCCHGCAGDRRQPGGQHACFECSLRHGESEAEYLHLPDQRLIDGDLQ